MSKNKLKNKNSENPKNPENKMSCLDKECNIWPLSKQAKIKYINSKGISKIKH